MPSLHYLLQDFKLSVVLDRKVEAQLQTTCFRGVNVPRSGNFRYWIVFQDFKDEMRAELIREAKAFLDDAIEKHPSQRKHKWRCTLTASRCIGWSSTASISDYPEDISLEPFKLKNSCEGVRMPLTCTKYRAPATNLVTLVGYFRRPSKDRRLWRLTIYKIHPGPDVGRLRGNVSMRHDGILFFDHEHPGEPIIEMPEETNDD